MNPRTLRAEKPANLALWKLTGFDFLPAQMGDGWGTRAFFAATRRLAIPVAMRDGASRTRTGDLLGAILRP
ncbi:MAG TPA: hypothetical protein VE127_03500 [Solirubrobacteraceae bacterium]|nr:hypothetical protein [Solirubrobacteraceae bacterium]